MSRKRRDLRPEERELWNRVARTAAPLHEAGTKPKPKGAMTPTKTPAQPAAQPDPLPQFRMGERRTATAPHHDVLPPLEQRLAQAPVAMDRKAFLRMKRGKLTVEGRIDLHGMTLDEAYPRLMGFILEARAGGKRLVLVITGKGRDTAEGGPIPTRRGVLRHQVPQWLRSPGLRGAVLQISEAHRSHGGLGAYYVYLRR
ncbi:DNA mismatch repair protein MutS [Mesobaculum littorinae]|uniref:DNA mismatch repair protein MutS n=1 Tax=Mesobaculum littorinae TaxID=2486419 RepID=A0A438AHE1_9RHOB|nr:Smr/MutS family protein [Mesobaculum littorinae]RVV98007.1 DNA mismatch repair protein MutS [Mesobaculum littorinae]